MKKNIFIILFILLNISNESFCHDLRSTNKEINECQEFAYSFINNPFSQYLFINDFLFISRIDVHYSDTPKKINQIEYRDEIKYPIIQSIKTIHESGQKIETQKINEKYMYIIRSKDDTGLLIKYYFYKSEFWNLYMIEDESI